MIPIIANWKTKCDFMKHLAQLCAFKTTQQSALLQIKANVCFMISGERSSKYKLKIAESLPNHALISVAVIKGRGVR